MSRIRFFVVLMSFPALLAVSACGQPANGDAHAEAEVQSEALVRSDLIVFVREGGDGDAAVVKSNRATCPDGYTVIGGGYGVVTPPHSPHSSLEMYNNEPRILNVENPPRLPNTWYAQGRRTDGLVAPWGLAVTAVCYKYRPLEAVIPDVEIPELELSNDL